MTGSQFGSGTTGGLAGDGNVLIEGPDSASSATVNLAPINVAYLNNDFTDSVSSATTLTVRR